MVELHALPEAILVHPFWASPLRPLPAQDADECDALGVGPTPKCGIRSWRPSPCAGRWRGREDLHC